MEILKSKIEESLYRIPKEVSEDMRKTAEVLEKTICEIVLLTGGGDINKVPEDVHQILKGIDTQLWKARGYDGPPKAHPIKAKILRSLDRR